MLGSGATFGYVPGVSIENEPFYFSFDSGADRLFRYSLFMSIGSVIRSEGPYNDAWKRARGPPIMLPRQYPLGYTRQ